MSEKIPFLDMFPDCVSLQDSCGGLDKAEVLDVLIERESMTMQLHTWFARMPAPVERTNIEQLLAAQFRLRGVQIQAEYPAPEQKKEEKKAKARVLMGKPIPKRSDIPYDRDKVFLHKHRNAELMCQRFTLLRA